MLLQLKLEELVSNLDADKVAWGFVKNFRPGNRGLQNWSVHSRFMMNRAVGVDDIRAARA